VGPRDHSTPTPEPPLAATDAIATPTARNEAANELDSGRSYVMLKKARLNADNLYFGEIFAPAAQDLGSKSEIRGRDPMTSPRNAKEVRRISRTPRSRNLPSNSSEPDTSVPFCGRRPALPKKYRHNTQVERAS
jgi:hypothetical protein